MSNPRRRSRTTSDALADRFVARRHQLSLTQTELADLAGVSRSSVQAIEAGKRTIQLDVVSAIAEALGCDLVPITRAGKAVSA
ncbi:helix-turn-helix transcriptional regulator [Antrihabitans sp. YC3-6]|uniref:Helix-turn-helix transcriptional regulator n=1 Tax=Antrihabitans stalagmiti TaxID=2799499 RepID=A0A934NTS6_9NOCA|nr:helix-turn-helix domain-containing protein [Antrihabitans stalagmiti]MBJ8341030.1 helix-turn-helix transcriptional regulator [Antrihabitans stalagmiti]